MAVEARVYGKYLPTEEGLRREDHYLAKGGGSQAHEERMGCPCEGAQRKMNSQRNAYANPLKRAYAATSHLRLWNGTFSTPIKGRRTLPRTLSRLWITFSLLYTKGQAIYTLTRTWRIRLSSWTLEYRS